MAFSLSTVPFSSTSDWNTPVSTNATYTSLNWPSSTGYNYSVNWDSYSPAVYVASASDPTVQVSVPSGWGYPGGTISLQVPASVTGAAGSDGELLVVDGNTVYDFWQFDRTSNTTATAASYAEANVATGTGFGTQSPFLAAGITAIGSSQLGGLLVQAETDTGQINHALELQVNSSLVASGFTGPAIAGDGSSSNGIVKEGELLAIAQGAAMPAGLSPLGQEVFHALQQYGAYVVDVAGGTTALQAQANGYSAATITALDQDLGSILPMLEEVNGGSSSGGTTGGTGGSTGGTGGTGGTTGGTGGSTGGTGGSTGGTGGSTGGGTGSTGDTGGTGSTGGTGGTGTSGHHTFGHGHGGGTSTGDPQTHSYYSRHDSSQTNVTALAADPPSSTATGLTGSATVNSSSGSSWTATTGTAPASDPAARNWGLTSQTSQNDPWSGSQSAAGGQGSTGSKASILLSQMMAGRFGDSDQYGTGTVGSHGSSQQSPQFLAKALH